MDISSAKNPELFSTESRAAAVIVGVIALLLIPTVAVGLRFYTRRVLTGRVSYDDWISLVALRLTAPRTLGLPVVSRLHTAFYLSVVFYNIGIMFVKLSFLAMYYRAMKTPSWRRALAFMTVLIFAWEVTQVFAAIFFCKPFPSHGDESVAHIKCIQYLPEWYQNTAGNIALNAIILLIAVPMVRKMRLPWAQKLALAAIFSLGIFTLAASIIRIKFLGLYLDTTFDNADAAMWSICEISAGLTCACLPTLRPLTARYLPRYFGYQRAGVLVFNRYGKSIPPPLPLHQRPIWYGAESPELALDTGVALSSGKTVARSVTTELDAPFDDYHKPPQYVYAAHPPKAAHPATTIAPQRPTLSRLISSSSSRRHSTPESAADRTEIIIIGLQCVRSGEGSPSQDRAADGGDGGVQQPDSVYQGWRNSETGSFGREMTGSAPSATTVPVVFWDDGRNLPYSRYPHHPDSPIDLRQGRGLDDVHNMAAQYGIEFEGNAATATRPGDLMMPATPDTPSTTQWYADAGRVEEANLNHIQGNNRNSNNRGESS
ncbi:satratoxin biosynthesis SC1 cluster protein 4 [Apiospora marii]|uniref:Satratoxin biosynthesis SC1 cluster protein 4 n=1 Tax=Apiospora marii TaxID=335849 RepID=A0ABR1REG6_9PEZI